MPRRAKVTHVPRSAHGDDGHDGELEIDEDYEAGTGSTARKVRGQIARQIRLRPAIEAGEHTKPYDTPLIEPGKPRPGGPRPRPDSPDASDGLAEALERVNATLETKPGTVPTSMRERLAQHRTNPSCNSCHSVIDPLGFSL